LDAIRQEEDAILRQAHLFEQANVASTTNKRQIGLFLST
jgi:hypothetical protein